MSNKDISLKSLFSFFFSFKGRVKRKPFIYVIVPWFFLFFIYLISANIFKEKAEEINSFLLPIIFLDIFILGIFVIFSFYSMLALTAKRLRDCNHSPWFCLLFCISFINIIFVLYLAIKPSATAKTSTKIEA